MKKLLLILMVLPWWVIGQPYKEVHISLAEGLSQSSVYSIVQDGKGFTWLATQDGLNKYDGTGFQVYRDEPFDTSSISANHISSLLYDSKGRLWTGTINHGLNLYNPQNEAFSHFLADGVKGSLASNLITAIHEDAANNIWIGTGNGLHRMIENVVDGHTVFTFEKIPLSTTSEDTITDKFINVIASGINNDLWVGTYAGLFQFQVRGNQVSQQSWLSKKNGTLSDFYVMALTVDNRGRVWAGARNGLDVILLTNGNSPVISNLSVRQHGMEASEITALYAASNGDIWVGYSGRGVQVARGIGNRDSKDVKFERVASTDAVNAMENGSAISFWEDKITKGIIWIGFNAGGLVRLVPVTKHFKTNKLADSPLHTTFVTSLVKDYLNKIWIGTTSGMLMYDPETKKYEAYKPSSHSGFTGNEDYVNGMVPGPDGSIFFGTKNELFNVKGTGKDFKVAVIPLPDEVEGNTMRTVVRDDLGRIYVVLRYSIYEYDPAGKMLVPVIKIEDQKRLLDRGFYLSTFFVDADGNYWLGTSSGLGYYPKAYGRSKPDTRSPEFFYHHPRDTASLRNQNILSITQDRNRNIWIGTMNGLTRVMNENGKKRFLNYSTRNGLKNNVIYAIVPDNRTGNLWLSTNNGLTEFNPAGTAVTTYDIHDGLQSNEFNSYASFKASDGEMFFGGIEGYTSFYPEQIRRDSTPPVVSVTGLLLDGNRLVKLADYQQSKTIDIKYKDNSFTVNFAGLHYADPQKNIYSYQLEGFHKGWINAGSSNRVNFSQLPPGQYIFRVKAANSDGVYSSTGDMFTINVLPPFYKTIWFYLLLAVFITGVLYGLHKYRLSMKLEQVREVEKIRRATAADFHDELGHKLTIISWFAEILKKKIGPDQADLRPHLDRIIEASGNLYHTMKDMLWAMDPDKDSVYDLYSQIREFGLELFDNTGILFDAESIPDELKDKIISPAYRRHVLLIFKEVMNNSLKHAHSTNTHLDLLRTDNRIKFRFRDNGSGFKMNGHHTGHGLINVKRRAQMIQAEINIHSEGNGTIAELDLPLNSLN